MAVTNLTLESCRFTFLLILNVMSHRHGHMKTPTSLIKLEAKPDYQLHAKQQGSRFQERGGGEDSPQDGLRDRATENPREEGTMATNAKGTFRPIPSS